MDNRGGFTLSAINKPSRKRRTNLNRRPPHDTDYHHGYHDSISMSSTPSDIVSDAPTEVQKSSDEYELFEDNPASASLSGVEIKDNTTSEVGAVFDGIRNENKFKKVKLKVGGGTRTIHTKSSSDGSSVSATSASNTQSEAVYPFRKLSHQGNIDFAGEKDGLSGVPWKDFSRTGFSFEKVNASRDLKQGQFHKLKHVTSKSLSDEEDDDEIRYLQKLKSSKTSSYRNIGFDDGTRGKKLRKLSIVMDRDTCGYDLSIGDYESSRSGKESKKYGSIIASKDTDFMEDAEEDTMSYDAIPDFSKRGSSITTRRMAFQTGTDNSPHIGPSLVQFPDGLPPAPPRKQKEQLSEVEQQLKRAEAAKRRKMQNEKAALESQAEAIRKILGQDSSRKRREDKMKKRLEELGQKRTVNSATVAPNVVRLVMGPSGTIITFPNEIGLPNIFEPKPCSYPPPREKCAGPLCTNVYKYRDSKSNLPLCSLRCYKAVHEKMHPLSAR